MQNTAVRFHPTNSRTLCSPLGFLGQHVRLFTHFRMLVDPCNICAILVRRSFPAGSCAEKTTAVLCRSPHGILPKRNPCTPRCFRAKHVPGAEKWSTKKTVKTPGISRSGWKAQKGEGVTPFGFDIRKIVSKTWGRKGEEKTDSFTCYFFSAMLVQHFLCIEASLDGS